MEESQNPEDQILMTDHPDPPAPEPQVNVQQLLTIIANLQNQVIEMKNQQVPPVKIAKPPTYSGKINESIDTWIFRIEQYFLAVPMMDNRKIPFAASFLTDSAATWWRHMYEDPSLKGTSWSWDDFKSHLRMQFRPIDAERLARDRLHKLRQTTSVSAYIHAFQNIIVDIPTMSEADRIDRFLRGLKADVHKWVAIQQPDSLADACSIANTIDAISFQNRSSNTSSFSRPTLINTPPSATGTIPMEIDAIQKTLTASDREALLRMGGCFYCRQQGHLARNCPKKTRNRAINALEVSESGKEEAQ